MRFALVATFALMALMLAGCSEEAAPAEAEDGPTLEVTDETGGIRGVVFDQSVVPVEGATVRIGQLDLEAVTDAEGLFTFSGLDPGTYFLDVTKQLYGSAQASTDVVAGVAMPAILKIQITKLIDGTPFLETHQFEGFYECAFAAHSGLFRITDQCDFAVRTAHDAGAEPVPRQIQDNINTAYYTWQDSILSIVQEGFWNEDATAKMWMFVDSTPIDNGCDCSDHTYVEAQGGPPTYGRADIPAEPAPPANWPMAEEEVAIRGFIPFPENAGDVQYAVDVKFDIFTTFFHNYIPQEGWNIQAKDDYPLPK